MDLSSLVSRSPSGPFPFATTQHDHHAESSHGGQLPQPFPGLSQQPLLQMPQQPYQPRPSTAQSHHAVPSSASSSRFKRATLTVLSQKVFDEAALYPPCKLGYWTYNPTVRLSLPLQINGTFQAHIPRRFLDHEQNSALRRRKVWGTDVYTDDSDLAALLLHATPAGQIPRTGDIKMTLRVMPRLVAYKSSMRNELRSRGWQTRHDGLSLVLEHVAAVSAREEVKGKGYAKRTMAERARLANERTLQTGPTLEVDWPADLLKRRSFRTQQQSPVKQASTVVDKPVAVAVTEANQAAKAAPGPDDTIEVEMEDPDQPESSFVEPARQGPLITKKPDILPTEAADQPVADTPAAPIEAKANKPADKPAEMPVQEEEVDIRKRDLTGQDILDAARRITHKRSKSRSPVAEMTTRTSKQVAHEAHQATGRTDPKKDIQQKQVEDVAALLEKEGRPTEAGDRAGPGSKTTEEVAVKVQIKDK